MTKWCRNYNKVNKNEVKLENVVEAFLKTSERKTQRKKRRQWNRYGQSVERGIGTKSYFAPSLPDNVLAPQTQIMDEDEPNFSEMKNPIIAETNTTVDNTQKDQNLDGLLNDMKSFKEFRDSMESRLHRMEEAIIASSNV